jgi:hypothetical protein
MGPGCVKTCTRRERAELFALFSSFDDDWQSASFLIQRNRDKLSTRKFDVGVFTQPGSKTVLTPLKWDVCITPESTSPPRSIVLMTRLTGGWSVVSNAGAGALTTYLVRKIDRDRWVAQRKPSGDRDRIYPHSAPDHRERPYAGRSRPQYAARAEAPAEGQERSRSRRAYLIPECKNPRLSPERPIVALARFPRSWALGQIAAYLGL